MVLTFIDYAYWNEQKSKRAITINDYMGINATNVKVSANVLLGVDINVTVPTIHVNPVGLFEDIKDRLFW